jgi:hypothetical protein
LERHVSPCSTHTHIEHLRLQRGYAALEEQLLPCLAVHLQHLED